MGPEVGIRRVEGNLGWGAAPGSTSRASGWSQEMPKAFGHLGGWGSAPHFMLAKATMSCPTPPPGILYGSRVHQSHLADPSPPT